MAGSTKTLGIKFEIAGVKEAQAGLNNLRNNLNQSIQRNKQAVNQSIGLNKAVRQEVAQSDLDDFVANYQQTVAAVKKKQYRQAVNIYARPRVNKITGGFFEGIGSAAGERTFGKLDNLFRRLTGREEHRETVSLDVQTIDKIGFSVARALTGKSGNQSQRDKNLGKGKPIFKQENLFDKALSQIMLPIKTMQYAFYEGIGSNFGDQFAEGLSKVLSDDLDFSMNRKGQVSGKAISYTATEGIESFKRDISAVGNNYNDLRFAVEDGKVEQVSKKFDTLIKSITKSITSIGDSYLRGFRKGSVQLEALRKMEGEINEGDNQAPDLTGKDKVIYTVSGFAGEKGQRGKYLAKQVKPYVNDRTEVIGVANEFTDVLAPSDRNAVMWGISALANLAKINLKGFNPDAVKLAAKVVNTLFKNRNVDVEMLGHSAGGFVVEEAQEILDQLGLGDKVKTKTVGTPNMAGNLENPNVTKIMGNNDFRIKPLEETLEYAGAAKPTDNVVGGVKDHFFDYYLASDEFLAEAFGDSLDKDKVAAIRKGQQKFQGKLIELESLYSKYMSTIYQDLDDLSEELSVAPDRLIAKNRRGRLRDRGGKELDRKLEQADFKEIKLKEGTKTAVLVSGGFSGAKGRSGATFAKQLNNLVDDETTQYVGVRNPFTDVLSKDDIRNPDTTKSIPKILEMFGEVHNLGYNPDAVEIAAQALDLLKSDPNLKVKVAGYSGGGYVAEDVAELLKNSGADMSRIEVMGLGTPELPGGIKSHDFKKILGEKDPVVAANQLKQINNQVKEILGFDIFPGLMGKLQNIEGIESHDLDEYVANSKEVQDFFYGHIPDSQELLGNFSQINNLQGDRNNLASEMEGIQSNDELDSATKLKQLNDVRERYIRVLKQIHVLAKQSQAIGGGKFFADEREIAAVELEDAGVIVDPIRVEDKNTEDPWQDVQEQEQEVVNDRNKLLALKYKQYLQNISAQTERNANIKSQLIARDFATQNPEQQKDFLIFIRKEFTNKAKAYRQSIKAGQLEVAKQQGENLLYVAASIKSLYSELANFDELDPSVQSTFKSYSGYVSSVENEVISGVGGKGRVDVGLPDIFESEINYSESAENGEHIAEGFINAILESLIDAHDAGEQLVDAVEEGIREQGEIQSPSKLTKRLGRWFAQGFGLGMAAENMEQRGRDVVEDAQKGIKQQARTGLVGGVRRIFDFGRDKYQQVRSATPDIKAKATQVRQDVNNEVDELKSEVEQEFSQELNDLENFVTENQDKFLADNIEKFLDAAGAGIIKKIGNLLFDASQNEQFEQVLGNVADLIGKVVRLIVTFKLLKVGLDALGLGKFIGAFQNLPEKAIDAAIGVESLDNRIVQMSDSAQAGAKNLDFISDAADRLNSNLTNAKENFSQVLRSTRDTALEGFQTENIYTAFAATAKANALSASDEQGLFRSVRSMIGKGILQSEEIRGEIGERLGDFEQSLAEAYGVSRPQLSQMVTNREIIATEALPKVAAVLRAKNDISGDLNTGAAAAQRADNAISSFQESVGNALLPLQKTGNNFLAGFFNKLASLIDLAKGLVHGFFISLFVNLLRLQIFGQSVQKMLLGLIKLLWTMKGALGIFLAETILIAAAWKVWGNVISQFNNRFFPKINKEIDRLTRGMKAYRQAIDEAKGAQSNLGTEKLQLAEGFKLPDNQFGNAIKKVTGSNYLNLDSLVREPLNKVLENNLGRGLVKVGLNKFVPGDAAISSFVGNKFTTAREVKEQQLKIDNSRIALKGNQISLESSEAGAAVKEIIKYDEQIAEIQSARLKLLSGDGDALKASLEAEKKINQERDKQLRIATNYQQTITNAIGVYKSRLEDIEQRFLNGEIDESTYKSERNNLQGLLGDTEKILKGLNDELSEVSKNLTAFQRRLRNSNERVDGFLGKSDRALQNQRAAIIEAGIADGTGTQTIQIELEEAQRTDLSRRIDFIKGEIANLESDLQSPELAAGTRRIKQRLSDSNIELNEISLQRIIDETTVKADRDAAQGLLDKLRRDTQLSQLSEQLAQSLQQNRNALIDYNRTIDDYFFNINQQIKEAQIEVLRVINQIVQTQIKNRLQSALSPNANSFVNGLISSTQSMLDQAASYAERVLGQRSARIQFAGQKRSLQYELDDFARNVRGAGDALVEFQQKLNGGTDIKPDASKSTKPEPNNSNTLRALRRAIIGKESAGNFKAVNPHSGALGYGQVMPANVASWTKQALGKSLTTTQFLNDSQAQIKTIDFKLNQYLQKELGKGFDMDTAVRRVASTWYSGQPNLYNNTRPQTYGKGSYPSIDSYTVDILKRFKSGGSNVIKKAEQDTNFATDKQEQVLDLTDSLIANQEKEALQIAIANAQKSDRQKVDFNITDSQFGLDKLIDAGKDLTTQYDFSSADSKAAKALRAFNTAFSDRGLQISREIIKYTDEINAINDLILNSPADIKMLRNSGRNDEADILSEQLANAQLLLSPYQEIFESLTAEYTKNNEAAQIGLNYVNATNKLKIEQEKLNKRSQLNNQRTAIAIERGTLAHRRNLKLKAEDLRLSLKINELRQQNAPGEYLDSLIKGESRQNQVNTENINYDSQIAELDLEKQLLDLQGQIGTKKAGFLSRIGDKFGSDKLKKDNAIATENLRFERQLIKFRKEYQDRPEELEKFSRAASELNRVNLSQIENEFRSLGKTVEDIFISSTQGFIGKFVSEGFDLSGDKDRQLLEEKLRYAEEINQLNTQYADDEDRLAHLKDRAKDFNEQKLDKINNEFNGFNRVVNLAKQALLEFGKQLAAAIAQAAAAKIIGSIIGGAAGGASGGVSSVGNDSGSGAGSAIFTADGGGTVADTVENFASGGDIKKRKLSNGLTSWFKNNAPSVSKAFTKEGEGAQLGVFHTGEELLSRKTGEAPIYQALKSRLGVNPLQQLIANYSDGGTVGGFDAEANILSGFSSSRPQIDLSALDKIGGSRGQQINKTVNLSQTIQTPNADSFNANADQRNQDLIERLARGV